MKDISKEFLGILGSLSSTSLKTPTSNTTILQKRTYVKNYLRVVIRRVALTMFFTIYLPVNILKRMATVELF